MNVEQITVHSLSTYSTYTLTGIWQNIPENKIISSKSAARRTRYGIGDHGPRRISWQKKGNTLIAKRYNGKVLQEEMSWSIDPGTWFTVWIPNDRWDNQITITSDFQTYKIHHRMFFVKAEWLTGEAAGAYEKLKELGVPAEFHPEIISYANQILNK